MVLHNPKGGGGGVGKRVIFLREENLKIGNESGPFLENNKIYASF
jgi:hypothetical protein